MTIDILVVDDNETVREGIRSLLNLTKDVRVIGEAENGRQAIAMAQRLLPDVIVMDIEMPELNGLKALTKLNECLPRPRVVLLSMYVHPEIVREAYQKGAAGYVLKQSVVDDLIAAIHAAHAGDRFFSIEHEVQVPEGGIEMVL